MRSMRVVLMLSITCYAASLQAGDLAISLRSQSRSAGEYQRQTCEKTWRGEETAVIVCDVWDYHHCLNAVRRLEEFAPRLNQVLTEARRRGATVIHAPSDCMAAYSNHPARQRAERTPKAVTMPDEIRTWCSQIPSEEQAIYPIDQSDGGEDDDPAEHAEWAAKLKALGRNPAMPWQRQSPLITIDPQRDYISDRGDEVWSILQHREIKHVILTGVHTNMCVLGRPFGLRQMVRCGMQTVLMRDMTDCMYNPQRWPYVDHFTGNDLIVSHVERYVCPTIASDQLLGGGPFRFRNDTRSQVDIASLPPGSAVTLATFEKDWTLTTIPSMVLEDYQKVAWYRCVMRMPAAWKTPERPALHVRVAPEICRAWLNGVALDRFSATR